MRPGRRPHRPPGVRAAPMPVAPCPPPSTKGATKWRSITGPEREDHPIGCDVDNAVAHNRRRSERRSDLASPLKGQPGNIGESEGSLVAIEARVGGQESVLRPFD